MDVIQAEPVVIGEMPRCIEECLTCHRQCLEAAAHLLSNGGGGESELVLQLWDCADICQTSAHFMLRGSALVVRTCEAYAEVCELCARECGRFVDDVRLQTCADACRRCAGSCRDMAKLHRNHTQHM